MTRTATVSLCAVYGQSLSFAPDTFPPKFLPSARPNIPYCSARASCNRVLMEAFCSSAGCNEAGRVEDNQLFEEFTRRAGRVAWQHGSKRLEFWDLAHRREAAELLSFSLEDVLLAPLNQAGRGPRAQLVSHLKCVITHEVSRIWWCLVRWPWHS